MDQKWKRALAALGIGAALTLGTAALDGGIVRVSSLLHVRNAPSVTATVRGKLQGGDSVTLYAREGDWWRIGYADGEGYVHAAYIEERHLPVRYVRTNGSALRVRAAPDTTATIIDRLPHASAVLILGVEDNFAKVQLADARIGYVSRDYLVIAAPTGGGDDAVALTLPSYKQYDSRWASRCLPGSGEKLSTHGCAVTALAMAESYRTGSAVLPTDILAVARFTSSGAIYWPAAYTWGGTDLDTIRTALQSGKPVILHAKKTNGSTHFAVVYGYDRGGTTASDFRVFDPGSASRTTLADLLAMYPYLVKTLY